MPKVIALAVRAALLSHLLLGLLALGWIRPWLAAAALPLFLIVLKWERPLPRPRLIDLTFLPYLLLYFIHALAPPTAPDAIGYHLGLPSEWLLSGSLARPAPGFYDALPHGLETLFTAAAGLGGLTAATLVHFAFLVATIPLMLRIAARLGFDGRPAALLYVAAPVVGVTGTAAYVDAALVFYSLATFWLLLEGDLTWAGLTAGFCYAVKMSGGVVTLATGAYLAWRRSWTSLAMSALMVIPWLIHSWWLTGNPVAPMWPALFPSPAFYASVIEGWTEFVRSYGVPWRERWWECTLGGARAQGLLGPAFLFSPVALLALRHRMHATLVLAAAIGGSGWFLNAGTRFLMPAAAFVALALAAVLPRRLAWALASAQAVLCWPAALDFYVPPGSWRLPSDLPWRAAFRLESEDSYLSRVKPECLIAKMVNRHVKPGERVLDFGEVPRAYLDGPAVLSAWQYAPARRAARALAFAADGRSNSVKVLRAEWPRRRLRLLRVELLASAADSWTIQELRLFRRGELVYPSRAWELDAQPYPWDAPLAFDRNQASGWSTDGARRAGNFLEIAGSIDADAIELVSRGDEADPVVRITALDERGGVVEPAARLDAPAAASRLNPRGETMRYVWREGFRWILAYPNSPEHRGIGFALADNAPGWGLARIDEAAGAVLLRIGPI